MINEKIVELFLELVKTKEVANKLPIEVGEKLLLRSISYFVSGEVLSVSGVWITLKDAAWIADTGRFADAIKSGEFSEVEPVDGIVRLNAESLIDVYILPKLPRQQK